MASIIQKTVFVLLVSISAFGQKAKEIEGVWKSDDKKKIEIQIYLASDGYYYGKIIQDQDNKNNVGKIILKELKYDNKNNSFSGIMLPPDKDIEANATITFENNKKIKVVAKKLLLSKTIYFTKVK